MIPSVTNSKVQALIMPNTITTNDGFCAWVNSLKNDSGCISVTMQWDGSDSVTTSKFSVGGVTLSSDKAVLIDTKYISAMFNTCKESDGVIMDGVIGKVLDSNKFENSRTYTIKPNTIHTQGSKVGRNEKCPCGSGNKNKKCCLKNKK